MDIFPKEASPAMSGFILNLVGPDLLAHPETKLKVLVNPDAVRAFSAAKTVHGIVVPSVAHGFPRVTGSSNESVMFGAALAAVAYGSHVIGHADWTKKTWNATLQQGPSLCEVTMKRQTAERFEQRHKDLCVILARLCAVGRSKWKMHFRLTAWLIWLISCRRLNEFQAQPKSAGSTSRITSENQGQPVFPSLSYQDYLFYTVQLKSLKRWIV